MRPQLPSPVLTGAAQVRLQASLSPGSQAHSSPWSHGDGVFSSHWKFQTKQDTPLADFSFTKCIRNIALGVVFNISSVLVVNSSFFKSTYINDFIQYFIILCKYKILYKILWLLNLCLDISNHS